MNTVKPIECFYTKEETKRVVRVGKKYYMSTLIGEATTGRTYYDAIRQIDSVEFNNLYRPSYYRIYPRDTYLVINDI